MAGVQSHLPDQTIDGVGRERGTGWHGFGKRNQRTRTIFSLHVAAIRSFGPDAYSEEQVAAWAEKDEGTAGYPIDEPGHHLVVAEADGVVGYGHLVPESDEVRAVYVHPDAARRGIGSAILAHLEGYARGIGLNRLELWASHNAVAFYERVGYRPVREETIEKGHDGHTVVFGVDVMEKSFC